MNLFDKVKSIYENIKDEIKDANTRKEVEEFQGYSRQVKRHLTLVVNDKEIKALDYIKLLSDKMPMINLKATGEVINHRHELRTIYMEYGRVGINKYVDKINYFIKNSV